jgi:MFS family permease
VTGALLLTSFLTALEATVVATVMPTVVGELGGLQAYAWVFTGYLLASTVTVPLYGKLADVHGRKPWLQLGTLLFVLGSVGCGLSQTMGQLVLFRVVQGLGAGAVQPIGLTMTGDLFSLKERGRVQALFSAVWGTSALAGPLLGALVIRVTTWRWLFLVNVPLGLLCMAMVQRHFREVVQRRERAPMDWAGAALLTVTVLAVLLGVQRTVPFGAALAVALLGGALFVAVERRAADPVVPLPLLKRPVLSVGTAAGALLGGTLFAATSFVPLYAQAVLGRSATDAGTLLTGLLLGWPLASTWSGRMLGRVPFHRMVVGGGALVAASTVAAAWLLGEGSLWGARAAMLVFGLGLGFANTGLIVAVQTGVQWHERGVATALTMFARTMGGTVATGALGGVLAGALARAPGVTPAHTAALLGPEHGHGLDPALLSGLTGALREGLLVNLWAIAAMGLGALAVGLLFPRAPAGAEPPASITPVQPEV